MKNNIFSLLPSLIIIEKDILTLNNRFKIKPESLELISEYQLIYFT
jgi:hypothetical protein